MTEIKFNSSDDLENIHILEKKLIERVKHICNIDKKIYVEIKLKLVELAEKLTTENKLKFLLFLDDTGLNLEDVAELMPNLFTHCITHLFIKNLISELIEIRDDISQSEDIKKIYNELHFFSCSTYLNFNEPPPPTLPPPPTTKPKRKPRTKPKQTEQDKEQKKEICKKLDLIFNTEPPKEPEPAGEAPQGSKPEPEKEPAGEAPQGSKPEKKEHSIFKPKRKPRTKKPVIYNNETEQKPKISPVEKIELKFY